MASGDSTSPCINEVKLHKNCENGILTSALIVCITVIVTVIALLVLYVLYRRKRSKLIQRRRQQSVYETSAKVLNPDDYSELGLHYHVSQISGSRVNDINDDYGNVGKGVQSEVEIGDDTCTTNQWQRNEITRIGSDHLEVC